MSIQVNHSYRVQTKDYMQKNITILKIDSNTIQYKESLGNIQNESIEEFNRKYMILKEIHSPTNTKKILFG